MIYNVSIVTWYTYYTEASLLPKVILTWQIWIVSTKRGRSIHTYIYISRSNSKIVVDSILIKHDFKTSKLFIRRSPWKIWIWPIENDLHYMIYMEKDLGWSRLSLRGRDMWEDLLCVSPTRPNVLCICLYVLPTLAFVEDPIFRA